MYQLKIEMAVHVLNLTYQKILEVKSKSRKSCISLYLIMSWSQHGITMYGCRGKRSLRFVSVWFGNIGLVEGVGLVWRLGSPMIVNHGWSIQRFTQIVLRSSYLNWTFILKYVWVDRIWMTGILLKLYCFFSIPAWNWESFLFTLKCTFFLPPFFLFFSPSS